MNIELVKAIGEMIHPQSCDGVEDGAYPSVREAGETFAVFVRDRVLYGVPVRKADASCLRGKAEIRGGSLYQVSAVATDAELDQMFDAIGMDRDFVEYAKHATKKHRDTLERLATS